MSPTIVIAIKQNKFLISLLALVNCFVGIRMAGRKTWQEESYVSDNDEAAKKKNFAILHSTHQPSPSTPHGWSFSFPCWLVIAIS